ncbi:MAG: XdhC family protein [Negativicutes bacterium]|nr:XdhC family protein [Negativicutes bacterium]
MGSLFDRLREAIEAGISVNIITLVETPADETEYLGQIMLVFPDGDTEGTIVDADVTAAIINIVATKEWSRPVLLEVPGRGYRIFWNRSEKKRRAVIAGGGHISLPLSEILALADFSVTVIDDRLEFAHKARFPKADQVICDSFARALGAVEINSDTAVIIMTRGHRYDTECLRAVLDRPARYIGMIGSRRRIRALIEQFAAEGVKADRLASLYAPIGLDLGSQTPGEIAVSIAAEVVAAFRGGDCRSLSRRVGEKHG